jgi:hypothetical protein
MNGDNVVIIIDGGLGLTCASTFIKLHRIEKTNVCSRQR